jgi:tetratricopeptide (TPR) repeat protein
MKPKPVIPLGDNHRRGIVTALLLLDRMLCEVEEYARGREVCSVFYIEQNALSADQSREAFWIAEPRFRRAIWLNPFEAQFQNHLAWCLYKQGELAEASEWAQKALDQRDDPNTCVLIDLIGRKLLTRR